MVASRQARGLMGPKSIYLHQRQWISSSVGEAPEWAKVKAVSDELEDCGSEYPTELCIGDVPVLYKISCDSNQHPVSQ